MTVAVCLFSRSPPVFPQSPSFTWGMFIAGFINLPYVPGPWGTGVCDPWYRIMHQNLSCITECLESRVWWRTPSKRESVRLSYYCCCNSCSPDPQGLLCMVAVLFTAPSTLFHSYSPTGLSRNLHVSSSSVCCPLTALSLGLHSFLMPTSQC